MNSAPKGDFPRVSIITACYRSAKTLDKVFESLRSQTFRDFEHIVIDGGSQDGTVDVIRRNAHGIAYWVSEKDKGIADAWNKGLAQAKGEIIGLLNADDSYSPDTLEKAVACLAGKRRTIAYGRAKMIAPDSENLVQMFERDFNPETLEYGFGFMHTTCFVPRAVYDEVGGFDTRYRIAIDTDFLLRCHFRGVEFEKCGVLTTMRDGGLSQKNHAEAYHEYLSQLWRHGFPKSKVAKAAMVYWLRTGKRKMNNVFSNTAGK